MGCCGESCDKCDSCDDGDKKPVEKPAKDGEETTEKPADKE